ncbi:nucleoside deaminase [Enterococcus sp. MMGLQ5-2]|nr:nucleoside deaminase [Enterococcus sp. MMGLQ5-1]NPD37320.1 nucleoside deaminase [Enterococcus sp. MMGLQ5-2]
MSEALLEAEKAYQLEEIPIGAVVVKDKKIIARSFNQRELRQISTAHAEVNVIEAANHFLNNWRLLDCQLFVTIEPCVMCAGAIGLARISELYYGAINQKFGAVDSLYQVLADERLNHQVYVEKGILAADCQALMQKFFKERRKS